MATIVTKSIGTNSRDYSTLQAWEDACPSNLVTVDQVWKGECYNDSAFTSPLTIGGMTTDSTRYVWLTTASGQAWKDIANIRNNQLFPLATNDGVRLVGDFYTEAYRFGIKFNVNYCFVENLQIHKTNNQYGGACIGNNGSSIGSTIQNCLCLYSGTYTGGGDIVAALSNYVYNCLIINTSNKTSSTLLNLGLTSSAVNCTVINLGSTSSLIGINAQYSSPVVTNCAVFGCTTAFNGTFNASSGYNATDQSSAAGSNNQVNLDIRKQFRGTSDYRLLGNSALINTGYTDATYAPNDITGTARGTTTAGDIGCWEAVPSETNDIIVSSIGTSSRDYSTLQAWEDAAPSSLVDKCCIWKGEAYNDSEFTAAIGISGSTADSTHYKWLTAAPGHSFQDRPRSTALYYNASNGVATTQNAFNQATLVTNENYAVVERIQFKRSGTNGDYFCFYGTGSNVIIKNCIFLNSGDATATNGGSLQISPGTGSQKFYNCLIIEDGSGFTGNSVYVEGDSSGLYNCTIVRPASRSTDGIGVKFRYSVASLVNCAIFNFTTAAFDVDPTITSATVRRTNMTDDTTLYGQDAYTSKTFSNQFENTTNDFRLKSTSDGINKATAIPGYSNDITGHSRDLSSSGSDIGCYEYAPFEGVFYPRRIGAYCGY